jgi:hypothetical protein
MADVVLGELDPAELPPHGSAHTDGTDDLQSATAAQKGLATAAQITALEAATTKLAGIEAGADVTDAANVAAAGAVMKSLFAGQHSLICTQGAAATPAEIAVAVQSLVLRAAGNIVAQAIAEARLVGRKTGGNLGELTGTEATALLDVATAAVKGLCPVLSDDDTEYLNGKGAWAVPAGGGGAASAKLRVYLSAANQSIPSGAETRIEFDAEAFDTTGLYDTGGPNPHQAKIITAGYYLSGVGVEFDNPTNGKLHSVQVRLNGTTIARDKKVAAADATDCSVAGETAVLFYAAANDLVDWTAYHTTGANRNIIKDEARTFAWLIGPIF